MSGQGNGNHKRLEKNENSAKRRGLRACFDALEERRLFSFFAASPIYNVGGETVAATTADLRSNGKQDVIVGDDAANQVGVLLGNGDGTFQGMADYSVPAFPTALATADINGDGHLDVIVANGDNVSVLFGNGDGTLAFGPTTPFTTTHSSLAIGDFNGDGKADVVANNLLLIGNGDGTFQAPVTLGPSFLSVAAADVNGDGKADIIASALTSSTPGGLLNVPTLTELLGNGDGTFQPAINNPFTGGSVTSGIITVSDLNADGTLDVAILGSSANSPPVNGVAPSSTLNVFLGNGDGTFQSPVGFGIGEAADSMVSADLNSDGINDLLIGTGNGDGDDVVYVVQGQANAAPATPFTYSPGTENLAALAMAADFNGDGHTDFAAIGDVQSTGLMNVVLNNGDGTFGAPKGFASDPAGFMGLVPGLVPTSEAIVTGDFNHDGKLDLGVLNEKEIFDHVDIMLGNGDGTFQPAYEVAQILGQGARFITADVNKDGNLDFVFAGGDSTDVIYGNGDGTFQAPVVLNFAPQALIANLGVGDYNGDGKPDIIESAELTSAEVIPSDYVFLANGDGSFQAAVLAQGTPAVVAAFTAPTVDLNSDGIPDLIFSDNGMTNTDLGLGDGAVVPSNLLITGALPLPSGKHPINFGTVPDAYAVGDFNGDGTPDLAVGTFLSETVAIALNSSTWDYGLNGATSLKITPLAPVQAGQPANVEVEALDAEGNVDPNFQGVVSIDLPDPGTTNAPQVGDEYRFTPADGGVHIFSNRIIVDDIGSTAITVRALGLSPTSLPVTVVPGPAAKFLVTQSSAVAGTPLSFTLTAEDQFGHAIPDYTGTVHFTSSDPSAILPVDYTFAATDHGTHTFSATLTKVGSTITATDTVTAGTTAFTASLVAAAPVQLLFTPLSDPMIAGDPSNLVITAVDQFGNTATSSGDALHFSSSDARAVLPAGLSTAAGKVPAPIDFLTAGSQTITVTDVSTGQSFSQTVNVIPNFIVGLSIAVAPNAVAGASQTVTVSSVDAFGNINPSGFGTLHVTTTDGAAVLPADYLMTSADNGTHSFAVEFKTPGVQTLTVNLIGGGGGANSYVATTPAITVTPGAAAAFRVTGLANAVAGTAQSFAVAAIDSVGNVVPNYVGTVAFSSTDVQAGLPASYTFTAADTGAHAFTATLKTAGSQSVSVSDASHTLSGTEAGITITPAAMTRFGIAAPTTAATGKSFSVTVSALDAFGNLVPTYRGKVHFTDTLAAGLPSDYTFNATDNGQHTFSLSLKTAGTQTLDVLDTLNNSIFGAFTINITSQTGGGGGGGATGGGGGGGGKAA